MAKKMIRGLWENLKVVCTNHDEPVDFVIQTNENFAKTPYYMCKEWENCGCANRMNLDDYQDACLSFFDMVAEQPFYSQAGRRFPFKGHRHKYVIDVLVHNKEEVVLGVRNTTVLGE